MHAIGHTSAKVLLVEDHEKDSELQHMQLPACLSQLQLLNSKVFRTLELHDFLTPSRA